MNGEQANPRFHELDREMMRLVVQNSPLYEIYVDVLGLIHDLICEFTDSLEKPQFNYAQIEEYMDELEERLLTDDILDIPREVLDSRRNFKSNIDVNYYLARNIRDRAERSETTTERSEIEHTADQFIRSLLRTYTTLRILKKHNVPAHQ